VRREVRLLALVVVLVAGLATAHSPAASARTVWLCRPGLAHDPCTPGLATTVFSPTGKRLRVEHPQAVRNPAIDCFYVYPTVSDQKTTLANFHVDPVERSIALYQVARYSSPRSTAPGGPSRAPTAPGACTCWTRTSTWATC